MNVARIVLYLMMAGCFASAQISSPAGTAPAPAGTGQPIDAQLRELLGNLEVTSQNSALQLARLRIEKWKTDGDVKREAQQNSDALQPLRSAGSSRFRTAAITTVSAFRLCWWEGALKAAPPTARPTTSVIVLWKSPFTSMIFTRPFFTCWDSITLV